MINSRAYDNHTFEFISDEPQTIQKMLSELNEGEVRLYDMTDKFDIISFENDFNNGTLDDYWCVTIKY
jgi:hypothetical protein